MAHRKEVFESKVLQKLYPAAPKLEKEPSPPRFVETLAKNVKRKASQEDTAAADAGKTQSAANLGRRMYTVLPPPPDYKTDLEKSVTLPQLQSVNSAEDPAEESVHDTNEDQDKEEEEEEEEHKRRRRKRKRKQSLHQDSGKDPVIESSSGQIQMPVDERGECISKNRKRKLKKKRHKEKLLSTGLMPRAAALEFTYRKDGQDEGEEEEEEEDNKRRAAEVSDFLRTTMEIYMSDSSLHVDKLHLLSGVVDDLLSGIASGRKPASVLKQLYALKAFVQQKQTDELEKALKKLYNTSSMSADETTAVVSLFRYWITDIFPMQGDKKTRLSTVHL